MSEALFYQFSQSTECLIPDLHLGFYSKMCCRSVTAAADDSVLVDGGQYSLLYRVYMHTQWGNNRVVGEWKSFGNIIAQHD